MTKVAHRNSGRIWLGTGLLFGVPIVAAVAIWLADRPLDNLTKCAAPQITAPNQSESGQALEFQIVQGQQANVAFGRSDATRNLAVQLSVSTIDTSGNPTSPAPSSSNDKSVLGASVGLFSRSDGEQLTFTGKDGEHAAAWITRRGSQATLWLCVERWPGIGHPGQYSGLVSIDDDRARPLDVPVQITLSYDQSRAVALLLPVVFVAGAVVAWVARENRPGTAAALNWTLLSWATTVAGVAALLAGTPAMVGVFFASYASQPAWGSSSSDVWVLLGALYTGFVGAATSAAVVSSTGAEKDQTSREAAAQV